MAAASFVKRLPEFDILHRLLVGRLPAVALPGLDPASDALAQIIAVGVEVDGAGPLECVERFDRGRQLHAVVGGSGLAARRLLHRAVVAQHRAPDAGPRIARAGPIRETLVLLHHVFARYSEGDLICRWNRIRRTYSIGSRFCTSAPSGIVSQSKRRVSMKRNAEPRASNGSAATSASTSGRTFS